MRALWEKKWKALFVWVSSYLSIIAFALVGGYATIKGEDKALQSTVKRAFFVTLIFTALSMFLSLYSYIGGLTDGYYSSGAYDFYSILNALVGISEIVVYVVLIIVELLKGDNTETPKTLEE